MKKISIIVPVYNAEAYIEQCVNSLCNQTYSNLEILLINDGSSDTSLQLCTTFAQQDTRITVFNQKNQGVSAARNTGLRHATGDYVSFVDADDWLELDAMQNMMDILSDTTIDCVRAAYYTNDENGRQLGYTLPPAFQKTYRGAELTKLVRLFATGKQPCYTCLLVIKKSALKRIGLFDTTIRMMEDVLFYAKLLTNIQSIALSNTLTYHYRQNSLSASKSPALYARNAQDILLVNKKMKQLLLDAKTLPGELKKEINVTHGSLIANYPFRMYVNGSKSSEIHQLFDTLHKNASNRQLFAAMLQSSIGIHLRINAWCLLNNRFSTLLLFFSLRTKARTAKTILHQQRRKG